MSKLSAIRKTLEDKADIVHVEEDKSCISLAWPHKVMFYVVPKEPLYKIDKLNAFMDSLFTDIQPDYKSYFKQGKGCIFTGSMHFDEKIGEYYEKFERIITISDAEAISEINRNNYWIKEQERHDMKRRVFVMPYPSRKIAEEILHHHLPRWKIDLELIREFHDDGNFFAKLLHKLYHKH